MFLKGFWLFYLSFPHFFPLVFFSLFHSYKISCFQSHIFTFLQWHYFVYFLSFYCSFCCSIILLWCLLGILKFFLAQNSSQSHPHILVLIILYDQELLLLVRCVMFSVYSYTFFSCFVKSYLVTMVTPFLMVMWFFHTWKSASFPYNCSQYSAPVSPQTLYWLFDLASAFSNYCILLPTV